ncbi:protein of unknown function (DUF220) [Quillaja saponaria]|uniref:DUF220 domain-containing protein n=1 Tax=Quillaja saponaria TaxID=32244 RepID=A0AAD7PG39_QUISA|nr:protein of unknown function (DUF220) [Quillaja saponaria]
MMGETEVTKSSLSVNKNVRKEFPEAFHPAISTFFVQLQNGLKSQLTRLAKKDKEANSVSSVWKKENGSSSLFEDDLDRQLQAWRENPSWDDQPPQVKVSVPKGSLCNLNVKVNVGLPPDAIYNIVTDPDNRRVFKNIKEVLSRKVLLDEGQRQVVEVEQAAIWRFLWWSGTISVHVLVDQNREDYSMKFKQVKTGFMKKFEGRWSVEPLFIDEKSCLPFKPKTWEDYWACTGGKGRIASQLSLEQIIQPAIVPPPPISWYLRGITSRTTEMLIQDLLAEAARIREGFSSERSREVIQGLSDKKLDLIDTESDIKERWALRRRKAKQSGRRLLIAK